MTPFKFSLERVRQLRERMEQEAALHLARAQQVEGAAQAAHEVAAARQFDAADRLVGKPGTSVGVGELRPMVMLRERLTEATAHAATLQASAHAEVEQGARALSEAMQQRRVLDRLRDKKHTQWKAEENREDLGVMDEVARARAALDDLNRRS